MKLNSNTILLDDDQRNSLVEIVEKIAKENEVNNVREAQVVLDPTQGKIKFVIAEEMEQAEQAVDTLKAIEEKEEGIVSQKEQLHEQFKELEDEEEKQLEILDEQL